LNALLEHRIDPLQVYHQRTQESPSCQRFRSTLTSNLAPSDLHYNFGTPERHFNYGLQFPGANPSVGESDSPVGEYFPFPPPSLETWVEYLRSDPVDETEDERMSELMADPEGCTCPPLLANGPDFIPSKSKDLVEDDCSDGMNNYLTDIEFDTPTRPGRLALPVLHVGLMQMPGNEAPTAFHPLPMFLWENVITGSYTLDNQRTITAFSNAFRELQ
jgi:hypothetical protein